MNLKHVCWRLLGLIALLGLSLATSVVDAQTLYAATGSNGVDGQLFTIDPTNGASTLVGNLTVDGAAIGITGLAFQPGTGILYGATSNASPNFAHSLVTIDRTTGAATMVGDLGLTPAVDLTFGSDGTLYGWQGASPYSLMSINLTSGAITQIGTSGNPTTRGGGLAFSPNGTLYLSAQITDGNGFLQTVDPTSGTTTNGPNITGAPFTSGAAMNAMAFDAGGTLFASNTDRDSPALVNLTTINTATGAVTDLGALPNNTDALAFAPVPGPSALLTALIGLAPGASMLLRRRRKR